jgi:hypothetical protein
MDFSEEVLQFLEIIAPGAVLLRQKILYNVAEALDPDAQAVERNLRAIPQSPTMQVVGLNPTLKSEVLEDVAAKPQPGRSAGERLAPASPLFAVEVLEGLSGFLLELGLANGEELQQFTSHRVTGAVQAMHPFFHHLRVPQVSQTAEESLTGFLHLLPSWIGINGHDAVGHRAATA